MQRFLNTLFLIIMLAAGVALTALGAQLVTLGGSPWYMVSGVIMVVTAVLGFRHKALSVYLFWTFLAANLVWAVWEVGIDGWALAPRLAMPTCLGLWMLTRAYRSHVGLTAPLPAGRVLWRGLGLGVLASVAALFWIDATPPATTDAYGPAPANLQEGEWTAYGNDRGGSRFSALAQITPANVGNLERVWSFHTGPAPAGSKSSFQANPLKIGDKVYICTGANDVIAIDAESGKQVWRNRTRTDPHGVYGLTCRGVTYYQVPGLTGHCAQRIYTATIDARLLTLFFRPWVCGRTPILPALPGWKSGAASR